MRVRRGRMDEFESVTSQLVQDSGDLAGAQEPDRQNHHQECPGAIIVCQCRRQRTRPRYGDRQQTDDVRSSHCALSGVGGYYQLRQLRPVARAVLEAAAKTPVQAFISCCLDYCNALLYGITDNLFRRLQSTRMQRRDI